MDALFKFLPVLLQLAEAAPELKQTVLQVIDDASTVFNHPAVKDALAAIEGKSPPS